MLKDDDSPSGVLVSFKWKHLALFLALDLLLFVLVFSAGVRVGQNLAKKPMLTLSALPGPVVKKKVEAVRPEAKKAPSPPVPLVDVQPKAPVVAAPSIPAPVPKVETKVKEPTPPERVAKVESKTTKALPPKEEAKVAKPPAKKASLTLQVSSHKDVETAQKIVDQLKKKGFDAFFTTVDLKAKGQWHRVRVGKYADQATAEQAAKEVGKALGQKVMIVPL